MAYANPERRRNHRRRCLLGATLRTDFDQSETDCIVRDMSPDGFRIALSNVVPLPETFDLQVLKTGRTQQVRLAWRSGDHVGVSLVSAPVAATPVPIGLMRDLRAARQEIVDLRTRLSRFEQDA